MSKSIGQQANKIFKKEPAASGVEGGARVLIGNCSLAPPSSPDAAGSFLKILLASVWQPLF
jgi:hypothetical protein